MAVLLVVLPLMLMRVFLGDQADSIDALLRQAHVKQQSPRNASDPEAAPVRTEHEHDRLLGGLLSPDFHDEQACRSRYEASTLWKTSPFSVAPYLVRRLRQYEANHSRCGPRTARYREAAAQLQSGRNAGGADCRYVVWLPMQGLGNRMLSLASTFLYALLTGRVVLVHQPPEMEGLFCEPFPGTSWLLPPDFPYKDGFWSGSKESYVNMLENNVVRYDMVNNASALPAYVYLHLENTRFRFQNHTFCEEDHLLLDKFKWMVLSSDSYFAVALFLMPAYREELDRMFPAKGAVFHQLGRYLFHPGNRAWGMAQRFFAGYLAGANERLGVQVRVGPYQLAFPFEVMSEQILRCTREHGLLPQLTHNTERAAGSVRLANSIAVKAVLVVSLKPEYYDKLHGMYYSNAAASSTGQEVVVSVYQPSHDEDQRTDSRAHNERALAEIYLLSFCDEVVTTGWSTFGYVAHSLAGLRPWVLTPLDWTKMKAENACVRPESVEPCMHSLPSFDCWRSGQDLDPVVHLPFLRHCEDVPAGLQLF